MKNKVLVKIIVPEIDYSFDVFIPTNELIWRIKKMLTKSINDLTGEALDMSKEYVLFNKLTNLVYPSNVSVYNTDIRNATELIFIQEKSNSTNDLQHSIVMQIYSSNS